MVDLPQPSTLDSILDSRVLMTCCCCCFFIATPVNKLAKYCGVAYMFLENKTKISASMRYQFYFPFDEVSKR